MSSIVFALHNHLKSLIGRHWSRTHGFFIVMGGFHLFKRVPEEQNDSQSISQENNDLLHPLLAIDLVRDDFYSFTMLTEAKIKDQRKSDWLLDWLLGKTPTAWKRYLILLQVFRTMISTRDAKTGCRGLGLIAPRMIS